MKIIKIKPALKSAIWGGNLLSHEYGKDGRVENLAESWELSLHPDGKATDENGVPLCDLLSDDDIGTNLWDFEFFPTLTKIIDASANLSVQVHPSDSYALKNENSYGKTEMWYVADAAAGAGIYLGLKEDITPEEFDRKIKDGTLTEILNFIPVRAKDSYFIPSGTLHAIGAGCLIYEVQQNSNLTYRVYDYGRKDAHGNPRELHIEKAKKVSDLSKFENKSLHFKSKYGDILGLSKYFQVTRLKLNSDTVLPIDKKSFKHLCLLCGKAKIGETELVKGDSLLVTADDGEVKININKSEKEECIIIMTEVRKYYVGIDLGGTFIKGGIVDDLGNIIYATKVPTEVDKGGDAVVTNIAKLVDKLIATANMKREDFVGIGMGVPGMIDSKAGVVGYSNNFGWRDFPISEKVSALTGMTVKIANDANVAALGEVKFGGGKNYENVIMLTLGTGVGGGVIIDGKLMEGNKGAGAELGHSCISFGGEPCSCGRRGCLEAYASATALIRDTKRAMEAHPESEMWQVAKSLDDVNGATAFAKKNCDKVAKEVVDHYIEMLGTGLTNIASVFRPEAILLGGGVSAEGDNLIIPLQKYVDENVYAGSIGPKVNILTATLGNDAGLVGAACLLF